MASSPSWNDPDSVILRANFHEADKQRFHTAKKGAEHRIDRELTNGEFVELLLDVYDLHLNDSKEDTHGN